MSIQAKCRICDYSGEVTSYMAQENMFGMNEQFEYFMCGECGCLQIGEVPDDLSKYYQNYYSTAKVPEKPFHVKLINILNGYRDGQYVLNQATHRGLARLIPGRWDPGLILTLQSYSKIPGISKKSSILDVGSGSGAALFTLKNAGFKNVLGLDPFIEEDIKYDNRLKILKQNFLDFQKSGWDIISFHHSLEHIPNAIEYMKKAKTLLKSDGIVIVRVPTVSSDAWDEYKTDWVQLDAPRHLCLHSIKSLGLVANKVGLELFHSYFDSFGFQYWASEQYRKGIHLTASNSHFTNPENSIFSDQQLKDFEEKAKLANSRNRGDQVVCYYRN